MRFGRFELDPLRSELRCDGRLVALHAQPLRLLTLLAERSGEVVSREEIRHHLWQEKVPYVCVVGDQEVETGGLAARHRGDGDLGSVSVEDFIELVQKRVAERR